MNYRKLLLKVGCVTFLTLLLSGCSTEDYNQKEQVVPKEVTMNNVSKNWVAAHFNFTSSIDEVSKNELMKSLTKMTLNQGDLNAEDQYSGRVWKGTYLVRGKELVFTNLQGVAYSFTITNLTANTMVWQPNFEVGIQSIEFVVF